MQSKPLPNINGDNREFWAACREHRLQFQRCTACGRIRAPGSPLCLECHAPGYDWVVSSGKGQVYSFVVYRVAPHPAFAADVPYVVAVVELAEGPHLLTNIVGCRPEDVTCGMPVKLLWKDINPEVSLPLFHPV